MDVEQADRQPPVFCEPDEGEVARKAPHCGRDLGLGRRWFGLGRLSVDRPDMAARPHAGSREHARGAALHGAGVLRPRQLPSRLGKEPVLVVGVGAAQALRRLAQERTRWAAVFEEDAALHPKLVPTPQTAIGLLRHALTRSRFAYLGACRPTCPASGSASGCFAYCTHAYALERVWAATFFDDVYCSEDVLAGAACGSHCRTTHCHTDQQFVRYFKRVPMREEAPSHKWSMMMSFGEASFYVYERLRAPVGLS